MKCPHCGRSWSEADLDIPGLPATLVLTDHVARFCPGEPAPRRQRPVLAAHR